MRSLAALNARTLLGFRRRLEIVHHGVVSFV